jgi:tRNA1Val (adenine37-N6)-methyltransferase
MSKTPGAQMFFGMRNDSLETFHFQQFSLNQADCAMKIGTDGIMLGAWAKIAAAATLLDIGTGTGLLALMAAQRNPEAQILGVEIEAAAAARAQENVRQSPWSDRIRILHQSVQAFSPAEPFEAILCNPPYFSSGVLPATEARRLARHNEQLSLSELVQQLARLLGETGQAHLVLPWEAQEELLSLASQSGLYPQRLAQVHSRPQKPPFRLLVSLGRKERSYLPTTLCLHPETGTHYHPAYQQLVQAFYLQK